MPFPAKQDGNVPFIGPRARYIAVGLSPAWVFHRGAAPFMTGTAPARAAETPAETDPDIVRAGRLEFTNLTAGGLFTLPGKRKQAVEVLELSTVTNGMFTLVDIADGTTVTRPLPSTPFTMAAGEVLRCVGNTATFAGALMQLKAEAIK